MSVAPASGVPLRDATVSRKERGRLAVTPLKGLGVLYRGSIISDARGSFAGVTGSRNRSGLYFRARVKPTQVPSSPRSRARSVLGSLPAAWYALTDAERTAWNDVATTWTTTNKLGDVIKLSGFGWFSKMNATRNTLDVTVGPVSDPPVDIPSTILTPPDTIALNSSSGHLTGNVNDTDPWDADDDGRCGVFITQGQNPGRFSPNGGFTYWATLSGNTAVPPGAFTLMAAPVALVPGRVYFVRFVAQSATGQVSPDVIIRVVCT